MKLAEALMLRTEMQTKLASLRTRIAKNAIVQDGDVPHEDPKELLRAAAGLVFDREALVARITATNHAAQLPDGRTINALLARREALTAQHGLLRVAIDGSQKEPDRYSMAEIKWKATVDVSGLQKQSDDLAAKIREVNTLIQQANWQIDLVEAS